MVLQHHARRLQGDENFETVRQRKDGANIPVSLTVSPIIDEKGGLVGASAIARDLSDPVKAE